MGSDGYGRKSYFEGIDQSLLRNGVETFRASTVVTQPYVVANENSAQKLNELQWDVHSQL